MITVHSHTSFMSADITSSTTWFGGYILSVHVNLHENWKKINSEKVINLTSVPSLVRSVTVLINMERNCLSVCCTETHKIGHSNDQSINTCVHQQGLNQSHRVIYVKVVGPDLGAIDAHRILYWNECKIFIKSTVFWVQTSCSLLASWPA
jgi:hypothetical protein